MNSKRHIAILLILIFSLGYAERTVAQNGGAAGAFSRIGFGPRGMAMGNALTSITKQGIYSYYNPALAAHVKKGNQVDLATAAMSFDRSFHTVNGTFRLPPSAGITLSLINAGVHDIDGRNIDGYDIGTLNTQEYQIATALGIQLTQKLSVGLGLKYFIADYHTDLENASTLGMDVGILYRISDRWQIGAAARDLLAAYTWNSGILYNDDGSGRTDDFPTQFRIGTSFQLTSDWLLSIESGRTTHENGSTNNLRIGSAYDLHDRITVRAGWQINDLSSPKRSNDGSVGLSIHLPFDMLSPSVDYAFIEEGNNISYMHTFGLRLNI